MYHIYIHASVDGHFGCLHVLTIVYSAAVNSGVYIYIYILIKLWFSSDIFPEVRLLDHMLTLSLVFEEPPYSFPQWLYQLTLPLTM